MTKKFCDRCGKELKKPKIKLMHWTKYQMKLSYDRDLVSNATMELCDQCDKDFKKWLEEKNYAIANWK